MKNHSQKQVVHRKDKKQLRMHYSSSETSPQETSSETNAYTFAEQGDALNIFNKQMFNPKKVSQAFIPDLAQFKVYPCPMSQSHDHKQCLFYHNYKDFKRIGEFYDSEMCGSSNLSTCSYGECCLRSHNRVESFYRHGKYKTKFCSYFPHNTQMCDYGDYCCFAHSEQEIQVFLIHKLPLDSIFYKIYYKTVWCPFNNVSHDRSMCVYAHNYQDLRRRIDLYEYQPIPCPRWDINQYMEKYEKGCPDGLHCNFCHGWKEFEFHPKLYKMKMCIHGGNCKKRQQCPYVHNVEIPNLREQQEPIEQTTPQSNPSACPILPQMDQVQMKILQQLLNQQIIGFISNPELNLQDSNALLALNKLTMQNLTMNLLAQQQQPAFCQQTMIPPGLMTEFKTIPQ